VHSEYNIGEVGTQRQEHAKPTEESAGALVCSLEIVQPWNVYETFYVLFYGSKLLFRQNYYGRKFIVKVPTGHRK
jgi:hypothetical protein